MKISSVNLSRSEKILLALFELSKGAREHMRYEDIVVKAFEKFPEDFQLRNYPQFPDSGDLVHKPLYDFRKKGLLEANNKVFTLTDKGLMQAKKLKEQVNGKKIAVVGRLSRFANSEVSRIESQEGFALFVTGKEDQVTDTDFYYYLAVTPRTPKNDFLGRLNNLNDVIKELRLMENLSRERTAVIAYHEFLIKKFANIITHFTNV